MSNLVNDFEVRKETLRALGGNPDGLANIYEVDLEILKLIGEGGGGIDWDTIKQKLAEDGVESIKFIMGAEQVILTASELKTLLNQTVLPDAPSDGKQYARQNGAWTTIQTTTVEKYMTITADKSNSGDTIISPTVTGSLPNLNLQYRLNGGDWTDFVVGTTAAITVQPGDVIQWRGNNPEGVSNSESNYLHFDISNECHISGSVMSLIDGVGDTEVIPCDYCFYSLLNNIMIKTVSKDFLPAMELKAHCYHSMLSRNDHMTQVPDLPAMKLAEECYAAMFGYCNNLTKAQDVLPGLQLAKRCYTAMFIGCSNLLQAPELKATSLFDGCYADMFMSCGNLNYVKSWAEDGISPENLSNWIPQGPSTGTFVKPDGVVYETGGNGIPEGWTVKEVDVIEVPNDGKTYGRNNGNWTPVESGYTIKQGVEIDNNVVSVENYGIHTKLNGNFISYESGDGNNYVRLYDKLEVVMNGEKSEANFIDVAKAGNGVVKTTNDGKVKFWLGTQQEYDAIATKDANTLYIIK